MAVRIRPRWNLASEWKLERTLGTGSHDSPIVDRAAAVAFSNDGKQLAVGGGDPGSGTVHVFTMADGKNTKNLLEVHSDTVMGLQFNATAPRSPVVVQINSPRSQIWLMAKFSIRSRAIASRVGRPGNTTDASSPVSALTTRSRCGT